METLWWQDGPELLGEALSVFADWHDDDQVAASIDSSSSSSRSSSSSSPGPSTTTTTSASERAVVRTTATRPVKINHSREREKLEMRQLRDSVVELEEELARLHTKREKRQRVKPQESSSLVTSRSTSGSTGAMVAWEKATRRQFHARKKAEAVNARLRELLRTHTAVADDLIRVIQRAEATRREAYGTALFPLYDTIATRDATRDQELEHRLRTISAQWHLPFAQCLKFHSPRDSHFFESSVVCDDGIVSVLEIRASIVFPFQRRQLEELMWHYFRTLQCTEDDFSLATELTEASNTLRGSIRATTTKDGVVGELNAQFMKHRFRNEHGELVITSTTCGRPTLHGSARGHVVDPQLAHVDAVVTEDSWLRLLDTDDATASLTCVQNVRRTRIQFNGIDRPDRRHVEAIKRFFAHLAENEMRWGAEFVERQLLLGPNNVTSLDVY